MADTPLAAPRREFPMLSRFFGHLSYVPSSVVGQALGHRHGARWPAVGVAARAVREVGRVRTLRRLAAGQSGESRDLRRA